MPNNTYRIVLWSSVLGTLALVIVGMVWLAKGGGQTKVYVPGVNEILADDHIFGSLDSKVTLVEYADFQCPACGEIYPIITKLEQDYKDKVRFVYRNFPIPGHMNRLPAAYAAGAAGKQGKFFEMAKLIFASQTAWSSFAPPALSITFNSYAQQLGLDKNKFDSDSVSQGVKDKVEQDAQSGMKAGVDSTPTFFLNGVKIQSRSYDEFKRELDSALNGQQ